jgi:aldehyde dehydrogenase (NAD+)
VTSQTAFRPQGLYINGAWQSGQSTATLEVENPATQEIFAEVPQATVEDVRRAIIAARKAFDEGPWPRMKPVERGRIMARMGEALRGRVDELSALNVAEAGSLASHARPLHVQWPIDYWCDLAERVLLQFRFEDAVLPAEGYGMNQGVIRREPFGVAALITAYNFPFELNLVKLGPAMASGCTVVLKPSPYTPLEALILGEIADEAGLPPGVLNVVTGDVDAGLELTTNPAVDIVSFTGSDTVGKSIMAQAAPGLKKVVLELGGKSANVILEDADLDAVTQDVLFNFTIQAGQGCSLATRAFVHESRYDELLERLVGRLKSFKTGDPLDPAMDMGPLISRQQREKVESLITVGQQDGAKLEFGGGRPVGLDTGYYVEPTLFTGVANSDRIARTEFFGPVGILSKFSTVEEAVALANDSVYGLGGGVWSADLTKAYEVAKQIRTGMIMLNGNGGWNWNVPFGGFGHSGLGRERGTEAITEYLEVKGITW